MSRRSPTFIKAVRALSLTASISVMSLAVVFKEDIKFAFGELPCVTAKEIAAAALALYTEISSKKFAML